MLWLKTIVSAKLKVKKLQSYVTDTFITAVITHYRGFVNFIHFNTARAKKNVCSFSLKKINKIIICHKVIYDTCVHTFARCNQILIPMKKALLFAGIFLFAFMFSCSAPAPKEATEAETPATEATDAELIEATEEETGEEAAEGDTIVMDEAAELETE